MNLQYTTYINGSYALIRIENIGKARLNFLTHEISMDYISDGHSGIESQPETGPQRRDTAASWSPASESQSNTAPTTFHNGNHSQQPSFGSNPPTGCSETTEHMPLIETLFNQHPVPTRSYTYGVRPASENPAPLWITPRPIPRFGIQEQNGGTDTWLNSSLSSTTSGETGTLSTFSEFLTDIP